MNLYDESDHFFWSEQPPQQQEVTPLPEHKLTNYDTHYLQNVIDEAIYAIPIHEKQAYLNAITRCPLNVRLREADPIVFMEFEDYNAWAASKRLVKYWEWRVRLFGESMAYESILDIASDTTTTSSSSNTRTNPSERVSTLISSTTNNYINSNSNKKYDQKRQEFQRLVADRAMIVLPETDSYGNFIFYSNEIEFHIDLDTNPDSNFFMQLYFYNCIVMINRTHTRLNKQDTMMRLYNDTDSNNHNVNEVTLYSNNKATVHAIHLLTRNPNHLDTIAADARDILRDAVPIKYWCAHLIFIPKSVKPSWKWLIQNVAITVTTVANNFLKHIVVLVTHICSTKTDIAHALLPYGMTPDMLPTEIGGTLQLPPLINQFSSMTTSATSTISDVAAGFGVTYSNLVTNNEFGMSQNNTEHTMLYQPNQQQHHPFDSIAQQLCSIQVEANPCPWDYEITKALEQLPVRDINIYKRAQICNNEVNPSIFIEYEGKNVTAGLQRFMRYWSWRVLLFGEPLAYHNILEQQHTTMDPIDTISKIITILPQLDDDGNYVMIVDISRFVFEMQQQQQQQQQRMDNNDKHNSSCETAETTKLLRLFMYSITLLIQELGQNFTEMSHSSEDTTTPTPSFVVLYVVKADKQRLYKKTNLFSPQVCEMLQDIVPAKLVRFHVLFVTTGTTCTETTTTTEHQSIRSELFRVVVDVTNMIHKHGIVGIPHVGTTVDLFQQLIPYGITTEMILSQSNDYMDDKSTLYSQSIPLYTSLSLLSSSLSTPINTSTVQPSIGNIHQRDSCTLQQQQQHQNSTKRRRRMMESLPVVQHHPDPTIVQVLPDVQQQPQSVAIHPGTTNTGETTTNLPPSISNYNSVSIPRNNHHPIQEQRQHAIVNYWRSRILRLETQTNNQTTEIKKTT